jgi:aminopeptidase YwaD
MASTGGWAVNEARLWEHLRFLCEEIGPRLSGTPADERAVEYLASHFRRAGAAVEVQNYPCPGWEHEGSELVLLASGGERRLASVAQTFTNGCELEARIAVAGTRQELEFRPDLEGTLLVVHDEAGSNLALDRNTGLLAIEERRPAAVVVVSTSEHVSSKHVRDPFLRVPAVAVSPQEGGLLMASEGARARLRIRARRYDSVGHNVIARLPGRGAGRVVVGAHYDTAAGTPGAVDDASGTAAVLELCDIFAAAGKRGLGLDFVAFGAEEYGRHVRALGSVEYVRRHAAETRDTRAEVQMDGIGDAGSTPTVHLMGWQPGPRAELLEVFRRYPRYVVSEEPIGGSDHVPFHLNGVPVLAFMNEYSAIPIHSPADSMALMDSAELAYSTEVVAAVVGHLAGIDG